MDWFFPSMLASITAAIIFSLLYYYLFTVYKDKYLLFWSLGWGAMSLHYIALALSSSHSAFSVSNILIHYLSLILGGAMLLIGTYNLVGRATSRLWRMYLYGTIAATLAALILLYTPPGHLSADYHGPEQTIFQKSPSSELPIEPPPGTQGPPPGMQGMHPAGTKRPFEYINILPYLFLAITFILCGLRLIKARCIVKPGRIVVGSVFILWGMHEGLYPWYLQFFSIITWVHLSGSVFSLIIAIGFAVIYLQKIHTELTLSRENYRELVQSAISIIIRWDTTGKILFVNDFCAEFFGFPKEELIGSNIQDTIHSHNDPSILKEQLQKITEHTGEYYLSEIDHVTKYGDTVWVSWTSRAIQYSDGHIEILSIGHDITQRVQTEKELAASERKYRHLVEDINDIIVTIDQHHIITYISSSVEHLTGWTPAELAGKKYNAAIFEEDRERVDAALRRHFEGHVSFEDFRLLKRSGETVWVRVFARPVYEGDEIAELQCVLSDMTEHHMVQEISDRSSRLESLGILAGGIAHDFNNILVSILGNISLTRNSLAADAGEQEFLSDAEDACGRAKKLTLQLLTFAKGGTPVKKSVYVADIIQQSADTCINGFNVTCDITTPDGLHPVNIDPEQIKQVMRNLIINAAEAMQDGGTITITAENMSVGNKSSLSLNEGSYVHITVRDHGTGIPQNDLPKIFDPYFTTKENASGLGLTTAYSVLQQHDGMITVTSETGMGTAINVYLPASAKAPEKKAPKPQRQTGKTGRILIMDDEPGVRNILSRMLTALGYTVAESKDGAEAVDLYTASLDNERFDIVIMDLTIPNGMGGRETIAKLQEIDPSVCAVVSSGYSDDPVVAHYSDYGFSGNISKPYNLKTLKELLLDLQSR